MTTTTSTDPIRLSGDTSDALLADIASGRLDPMFGAITDAVTARQRRLVSTPGTRVVINDLIRPKKFVGVTGTVVGRRGTARVNVEVDERWLSTVAGYTRDGNIMGVPDDVLTVL